MQTLRWKRLISFALLRKTNSRLINPPIELHKLRAFLTKTMASNLLKRNITKIFDYDQIVTKPNYRWGDETRTRFQFVYLNYNTQLNLVKLFLIQFITLNLVWNCLIWNFLQNIYVIPTLPSPNKPLQGPLWFVEFS